MQAMLPCLRRNRMQHRLHAKRYFKNNFLILNH